MHAIGSSFSAWQSIEKSEGTLVPHGLVFSLAVVAEIGRQHGLTMTAEEHAVSPVAGADAVMISVLDTRCLMRAAEHFKKWGMPFRRQERAIGKWPLVWVGGQGIRNPRPLGDVADLVVIGDAEEPLPKLLEAWHTHGNSVAFMRAASLVPGVWVPEFHDPREHTVVHSVAKDVGVTVRAHIDVSHNGTRRIEIARGCKSKCAFCGLGWRAPVSENSADDVLAALASTPSKRVHLQAGDAESHSGIDELRRRVAELGASDTGWTGRLDTLLENPDQPIPGNKRYAFGVEAMSHRVRSAIGKHYLSDDELVSSTVRAFDRVQEGSSGRLAWHMIAGLPGERASDTIDFMRVLQRIDDELPRTRHRNLSVHWQPFQPAPGTPMQWCACGGGARSAIARLKQTERMQWLRVRHVAGRTDDVAKICTLLARCDERGADLLCMMRARHVTPAEAAQTVGTTWGALPVDAPLPWDFIVTPYQKSTLERAFAAFCRRLEKTT